MDPQNQNVQGSPQPQQPVSQPTGPVTPQPTPITPAKKSKTGMIIGIIVGVIVLAAVVFAALWFFVLNKAPSYNTSDLSEITSGNAVAKADTSWTQRTSNGLTGYVDYKDSSKTGTNDAQYAVTALGSQSLGVSSLTDAEYEQITKLASASLKGSATSELYDEVCASGTANSSTSTDITIGKSIGWSFAIDCESKEGNTPLKGEIRVVIAHDGNMYMHIVAAEADVWDANTDYFETVVNSFKIND